MPIPPPDEPFEAEESHDLFYGEEMNPFVPHLHQAEESKTTARPIQPVAAQPLATGKRHRARFWQRLGRLLHRR